MAGVGTVPRLRNFVAGEWVPVEGDGQLEVPNPADGTLLARVPLSGPGDVARAVAAARAAFPEWARRPPADRARLLRRAQEILEARAPEIVDGIVAEHGKVREDAAGSLRRGLEALEFAQSVPTLLQGQVLRNAAPGIDAETHREPLGVVAGITPFNFPAMIPLWMAPMALACGNSFLLKPSERVPLTADRLAQAFADAGLPPGVFNVLHGSSATVDALLEHPDVDAVAFVGSAPVARHVYTRAAAHGKRVLALAGAKNHLIVMPDADLPRAVRSIVSSAYGSAGERCLAGSVVVAIGEVAEPLVGALASEVRRLPVGAGTVEGVEMGPLIRADHRDRVAARVREAEHEGAHVVAEGHAPERGFFLPPVLLDHVRPEMAVAREEIFGPVLAVLRVADLDAALDLANRSPLGNAAAIFTRSGEAARRFRDRIEAGMVGINVGVPAPPAYFPFVGWKGSVYGDLAATGPEAVRFYTRPKTVMTRWT
jgi:malonate-semialdehyde dehydrogenase (acetylating)/methylmalonate-semialdehyde dehydrogenase